MNLHDVWAEFTAELAHLFARFHSHPVVVAAVAQGTTLTPPAVVLPTTPPPAPPAPPAPVVTAPAAPDSPGPSGGAPIGIDPNHGSTLAFDYDKAVLPAGVTTWQINPVGTSFGIALAGMNGASHLTIRRPDGTVAQRTPTVLGAADIEFPAAGGSMYVVFDQAGAWSAEVRNDDGSGGQARIERLPGA